MHAIHLSMHDCVKYGYTLVYFFKVYGWLIRNLWSKIEERVVDDAARKERDRVMLLRDYNPVTTLFTLV